MCIPRCREAAVTTGDLRQRGCDRLGRSNLNRHGSRSQRVCLAIARSLKGSDPDVIGSGGQVLHGGGGNITAIDHHRLAGGEAAVGGILQCIAVHVLLGIPGSGEAAVTAGDLRQRGCGGFG